MKIKYHIVNAKNHYLVDRKLYSLRQSPQTVAVLIKIKLWSMDYETIDFVFYTN